MPASRSPPMEPYMKRMSCALWPFSACQGFSGTSRKNSYQTNQAANPARTTRTVSTMVSVRLRRGVISIIVQSSSEGFQELDKCVLLGLGKPNSVQMAAVAVAWRVLVVREVRAAAFCFLRAHEADVDRIVEIVAAIEQLRTLLRSL